MIDKYGAGQDPYCYPGTTTLRNLLDIQDDGLLAAAERDLSRLAAGELTFELPPYDLGYLCRLHRLLFQDIYAWAGELRTLDIAKNSTRFCTVQRLIPEADKLFNRLRAKNWFEGHPRDALIVLSAEFYGDLNMVHPFRDRNGRAQRLLFEHLIINGGYQIDWSPVGRDEWIDANVAAVHCGYAGLERIFARCIGSAIE
ncbi:Fic family protein [Pseudomonas sp. 102515]|uniref:Fic/DOC family protein n=1 Tax=Pseudomonas sp. 102515 TaxID=3071568 RepID=UPI0028025100|nr:Fic family protein [Pseudomonas sp. 102515]MDQ7915601.1 Fic family protein [Pseudomonas sp. 102515]